MEKNREGLRRISSTKGGGNGSDKNVYERSASMGVIRKVIVSEKEFGKQSAGKSTDKAKFSRVNSMIQRSSPGEEDDPKPKFNRTLSMVGKAPRAAQTSSAQTANMPKSRAQSAQPAVQRAQRSQQHQTPPQPQPSDDEDEMDDADKFGRSMTLGVKPRFKATSGAADGGTGPTWGRSSTMTQGDANRGPRAKQPSLQQQALMNGRKTPSDGGLGTFKTQPSLKSALKKGMGSLGSGGQARGQNSGAGLVPHSQSDNGRMPGDATYGAYPQQQQQYPQQPYTQGGVRGSAVLHAYSESGAKGGMGGGVRGQISVSNGEAMGVTSLYGRMEQMQIGGEQQQQQHQQQQPQGGPTPMLPPPGAPQVVEVSEVEMRMKIEGHEGIST